MQIISEHLAFISNYEAKTNRMPHLLKTAEGWTSKCYTFPFQITVFLFVLLNLFDRNFFCFSFFVTLFFSTFFSTTFWFMYTLVCFILSQMCYTVPLCSHLASVYHSNIDISGAIVFEINDSEYQLTLQRKALEQKSV